MTNYYCNNSIRMFNTGGMPPRPGGGGKSNIGGGDMDGYSTEEDTKEFDKDRRFSNYIMFLGAFSMGIIFLASNVV